MSLNRQQKDFGYFCPTFVGITLKFDSEEMWNHYNHLWANPGKPGRECLNNEVDLFEQICVGTVLEHEIRHFHDFLLSQQALQTLILRCQTLLNAEQWLALQMRETNYDLLPVPIMRWVGMSMADRTAFEADLKHWPHLKQKRLWRGASDTPAALKNRPAGSKFVHGIGPQEEHKLLSLIEAGLIESSKLRQGTGVPASFGLITVRHIFEVAAYLVQAVSIHKTYGYQEVAIFLNQVMSAQNLVARVLGFALRFGDGQVLDAPRLDVADLDISGILDLVTWCFLGDWFVDGTKACAVTRFALVGSAANNSPLLRSIKGLAAGDRWDYLDQYFNVQPWKKSTCHVTQKFCEQANRIADSLDQQILLRDKDDALLPKDTALAVSTMLRGVAESRRAFAALFLTEPLCYTSGLYLQAMPMYPTCPLRIEFGNDLGIEAVNSDELEVLRYSPSKGGSGVMATDLVVARAMGTVSSIDFRTAIKLKDEFSLFDVIFDAAPISIDVANSVAKEFQGLCGKQLCRIVG